MSSRLPAAYDAGAFRALGHRVVDLLADALDAATHGAPAVLPWKDPADALGDWPGDFAAEAAGDLPALLARVVAGSHHLHHPRYVGHQVSAPLPEAALAELVSAYLNNGMAVYEMGPVAVPVERALVGWMARTLGLPDGAGGVFTSGGSAGNLTALLAARQAMAGFDAWTEGLAGNLPLAVLAAETAHYSVGRSLQIMGLGKAALVTVPIDDRFRLRPDALEASLADAERAGRRVFAVVASAGSTATGAYDPLEPVAAFCRARRLWLHVDGAHGACAALSPRHRHLVAGIELADSVVWDAHKMLLMPALATAVLFREERRSYEAFPPEASYLFYESDPPWWDTGLRTLECTKRMLALPLYAALATRGTAIFAAAVEHAFDLAGRFAGRLAAAPDFEVLEPEGNIVCFRHLPAGVADADARQARVRTALVRGGGFYLVQTRLRGALWLRTSLMNPLTTDADLDALVERIRAEP